MPVHPAIQRLLKAMADANVPAFETMTPAEARAQRATMPAAGKPEALLSVEDRSVPGPRGPITVRVYRPAAGTLRTVVFLHGGGWVLGSIDFSDMFCRSLANASGCAVASVEYGLAPEHKYPEPAEDAYAAVTYVADHAEEFGGRARVAVAGESAGGNLAAAVTLMMRDRGRTPLAYQLLLQPVIDHAFDTPSYRDCAEGYFLTRASMRWFWSHYLRTEADGADAYASPVRAKDLRGLPPGMIVTAEYDPLRDEAEAYGARLREAGVDVKVRRYDGMTHGFMVFAGSVPIGRQAIIDCGVALREALAAPVAAAT